MKIFISGVTGYVGRNLAKHLIHNNNLVGLSRDLDKALFLEELGVKIFEGDLHASNLVEGLTDCDLVIHTAADIDHKNLSKSQYETNVTGTKLILEAAKAAGVKQFIHISTESVLLTGKSLNLATEDMSYPKNSVGEYSSTKRLAEELVLNAATDDFCVTVLRPRFIWGRDDTTAMPQIMKAIENKQFAWIDNGDYKTSTLHIANLCQGIDCAISHGKSGEIYFLTDDNDKTFKEMVSALVDAHGVLVPTKSIPRIILLLMAKLDNLRKKYFQNMTPLPITMQEFSTSAVEVTLDITKAKKELGYSPVISFQEGILEIKKGNV